MAAKVNLIGQTFGMLTVIAAVANPGRRLWLCRCTCGNERAFMTGNLRMCRTRKWAGTTNCGCKVIANRRAASLRHGNNRLGKRTKEYRAWAKMLGRCENASDHGYPDYGGRGITVCERWHLFDAFLNDMGKSPSPRHSIDRIDNDGNYEPRNCRWATPAQQARNTRRTIRIGGVCLMDICESRGLNYGAITARIRRGIPPELAISPLVGLAFRAFMRASAYGELQNGK